MYTTFIDAMNQARAMAGPLSAELEELPHRLDSAAATDPVPYSPCTGNVAGDDLTVVNVRAGEAAASAERFKASPHIRRAQVPARPVRDRWQVVRLARLLTGERGVGDVSQRRTPSSRR